MQVMNIKSFLSVSKASVLALAVLSGSALTFQGCSENIDDSDFAIKTELTVADYLQNDSRFSAIVDIFSTIPLSPFDNGSDQASPIISALSARGNYTVFAPTNEAVQSFAEEQGCASYKQLSTEQMKTLAYSCVIDNGNDNAYESPDFPSDGSAFSLADLSDRLITCQLVEDQYVLNGTSHLSTVKGETDIDLSNGMLHIIVDSPLAPSSKSVADMIGMADNMKVFTMLLQETGWADAMDVDKVDIDLDYENQTHEQYLTITNLQRFNIAQHRYLGFTAFVETDDVFAKEFPGVDLTNKEAVLAALYERVKDAYGTTNPTDYKDADNAINRFVAYHLLDCKVAYNKFLRHVNEYGFMYKDFKNPQTENLSVDIYDYYATAGKHRALIKVSQDGDKPVRATSHNMYLNRVSNFNELTYETKSVRYEGVQLLPYNTLEDGTTFDNNAKNGFYFPITGLLIDDKANSSALGSERIRFDICTILPELMSNNVRGGLKYVHFPNGYFANITNESHDTKLLYLDAAGVGGTGWMDYQADEFMACGVFDFVLKLPPVPADGMYELRMGVNHNNLRGMAQIYLGESPNNMQPAGLPYDMRQPMLDNDEIGYKVDTKDEYSNRENDKVMRDHGYMKGPRFFQKPEGTGTSQTCREIGGGAGALRKILGQWYFEKNKTYYIRFKSALEKRDAQFWIDYFEFCPSSVYNGTTEEDQW